MTGFAFGSTGEKTFIKQCGMHIVAVLVLFGACRCLPGKGYKQADRGQEENAEAPVVVTLLLLFSHFLPSVNQIQGLSDKRDRAGSLVALALHYDTARRFPVL